MCQGRFRDDGVDSGCKVEVSCVAILIVALLAMCASSTFLGRAGLDSDEADP